MSSQRATGTTDLAALVDRISAGWQLVEYDGRRYGLTRTDHVDGRSVAIYAEELGGTDVVSANIFRLSGGDQLKACEMPDAKVLSFLQNWLPPETQRGEPAGG